MKRLVTLTVTLLALTAVPFALASGGLGTFKATITGKGKNTEHGQLDATYTISLLNPVSGRVGLTRNGEQGGGGRYVISGSTITFTPKKKKNGKCKTKATYSFTLSGDKLTFTPIHDTCTTRRDILTFAPWTKVS
jgi:hypothetical protein